MRVLGRQRNIVLLNGVHVMFRHPPPLALRQVYLIVVYSSWIANLNLARVRFNLAGLEPFAQVYRARNPLSA